MLPNVRLKYTGRPDGTHLPEMLLLSMADIWISAGEGKEADLLLRELLPAQMDFANHKSLEKALLVCRRLIAAADESADAARRFFLGAVTALRQRSDRISPEVELMFLNRCFALKDQELATELVRLVERELREEPLPDSPMAISWYAAMALSCLGDLSAAEQLRTRLVDWPGASQSAAIRNVVLEIPWGSPQVETAQAVLDRLAAILDAIDDAERRSEALGVVAAILVRGHTTLLNRTLGLILDAAAKMEESTGHFVSVFEAICRRLEGAEQDRIFQALNVVFDFLDDRSKPRLQKFSGYLGGFLQSAFRLATQQTNDDRCATLLRRLIDVGNVEIERDGGHDTLLTNIVEVAFRRLPLKSALELLEVALSSAGRVHDEKERRSLLRSTAMSALRVSPLAQAESLALRLDHLMEGNDEELLLYWCRSFQCLEKRQITGAFTQQLADRLRGRRPPSRLEAYVEWIAALKSTSLEPLTASVAEELFQDLHRFTVGYHELQALKPYLQAVVQTWPQEQIENRFNVLMDWAASMPRVNNEDHRHYVFGCILDAAAEITFSNRDFMQVAVLNRSTTVLGTKRLWRVPLSGLGPKVLDRYMELSVGTEREGPASIYDGLVGLAVRASSENADQGTIRWLCTRLDQFDDEPCGVERSSLADAVMRCENAELKARLVRIVERVFESAGWENLDSKELLYLCDRPVAWWIEKGATITTTIGNEALAEWVHKISCCNPLTAVSVVLASSWLSRQTSEQLPIFWFELANDTAPVPAAWRTVLTNAAIGRVKTANLPLVN